ncbi:hypothetical protein ATCC90586_005377 [Pythium insidiosum]|nr:hypothetical protein ATCC90586_005377 [Pythium insidiosum]
MTSLRRSDAGRYDANALDEALVGIDTGSLRHIVIYNSSIVAWEADAAMTMAHHPSSRFVFIVRSQLPNGTVPAGLMSPDFPQLLFDIEFAATNLVVLPDEIALAWPQGLILYLNEGPITEVPSVLLRMSFFILSLAVSAHAYLRMAPTTAILVLSLYAPILESRHYRHVAAVNAVLTVAHAAMLLVHGRHYESLFLVRKLLETGLQVYHAYLAAAIQTVDVHWLRYLIVRHCTDLRMPPAVTTLHDVIGIKLYNTTITQWDGSVALTATRHPAIRFLFIVSTQLPNGTLPAGLLADDFPPMLLDIEFVDTNLYDLPHRVAELWPMGLILHVEHSRLTTVPDVLSQLDVMACSLAGNAISIVPPSLLESGVAILTLSGNPIRALPEDVRADLVTTMRELKITWTNISALPHWLNAAFLSRTVMFAGATPFCDTLEHGALRDGIVCDAPRHGEIGRTWARDIRGLVHLHAVTPALGIVQSYDWIRFGWDLLAAHAVSKAQRERFPGQLRRQDAERIARTWLKQLRGHVHLQQVEPALGLVNSYDWIVFDWGLDDGYGMPTQRPQDIACAAHATTVVWAALARCAGYGASENPDFWREVFCDLLKEPPPPPPLMDASPRLEHPLPVSGAVRFFDRHRSVFPRVKLAIPHCHQDDVCASFSGFVSSESKFAKAIRRKLSRVLVRLEPHLSTFDWAWLGFVIFNPQTSRKSALQRLSVKIDDMSGDKLNAIATNSKLDAPSRAAFLSVVQHGASRGHRSSRSTCICMTMLDGFVVPHAAYSVFHGSSAAEARPLAPTDHLALRFFSPESARSGAVPSDRHLREFVQLDAQLKALQQQLHSHSTALSPAVSRHVEVAQSAAVVECLAFFPRLLTPESFTWPDFLTTLFVKLAELYAHTPLNAMLERSESRAAAWKLLTTMPTLLKDHDAVRTTTLQTIGSAHTSTDEQRLLVQVVRGLLPFDPRIRVSVLELVLTKDRKLPQHCELLADAAVSSVDAQRAWTHCTTLYREVVDVDDAIVCLRSTFDISRVHRSSIPLKWVMDLFKQITKEETRCEVLAFAWSAMTRVISTGDDYLPNSLGEELQQIAVDTIRDVVSTTTTKAAAVQLLRAALGLTAADLDCLALRANACNLLADAIEALLLEQSGQACQDEALVMYRSTSGHVRIVVDAVSQLASDLEGKVNKISRLPSSRRPSVGATILQQLLTAMHELPWPLPHQFFRSSAPKSQKLHASVQFLTHSERTASTSKTRPRSTLGVAHGTDFTCTLAACVAMQPEVWRSLELTAVRVEVLLASEDKTNASVAIRTVDLPVPSHEKIRRSGTMGYAPVDLPVHVSVEQLGRKGNFTLQARLSVIDSFGELWPIESTGGHRGVIVY